MPYWRLFYHFVWGTKGREPLIVPDFEKRLYKAVAAKAIQLGGIVHAVGGTADHIHLAVSVPPSLAPARFIGEVKGNSSHFVNHVIRPDYQFLWQNEYGVVSFSERQLARIVRYIQNQPLHHAEGTLIPMLENTSESAG
ncbi:MAG: IS200/IS605 family transposase [Thermoflexales bacterium]|nr:IS200/IS605 family transposase [Thermoflexales bacterium]